VFKLWGSRTVWAALLVAATLVATSVAPVSATVGASASVKKVKLTVDVTPPVALKGTKGQCLITTDGYNIAFEGKDYPSLGRDGDLASGGPGPATDPNDFPQYIAFSATIGGTAYREDASRTLDDFLGAVTVNVKKKTLTFKDYPIVAPETGATATMSGIVKCK
jgi:hypothetical protein